MPNPIPNSYQDQWSGHTAGDINKILVALINRIFDSNSGAINVGSSFEPVGAQNSALDVSSAQTLTPPTGANKLMMGTATQNCRYTLDGSTPTATVGFLLSTAFPPVTITVTPSTIIRVIQVGATAVFTYQWGK